MKLKHLIALLITLGVLFIYWAFQTQKIENETSQISKQAPKVKTNELDQKQILQIIEKQRASFNRCYAQLLQEEPDAKGDVIVSLGIDPIGKIKEPKITSNFTSDQTFKSCLLEVIKRMDFPPHSHDMITTSFPLKFE